MTRNRKKEKNDLRGVQKPKKSPTGESGKGRGKRKKSVKRSDGVENAERPMCIVSPRTLI